MQIQLRKVLRKRKSKDVEKLKEILRKRKIHVYLCGPITFVEERQAYRESIKLGLEKISKKFVIHDPWEREQIKWKGTPFSSIIEESEKFLMAEDIIIEDLKDIKQCDILIAYLFRIGAGSAMEIFWAKRILNKPVVLIYTYKEDGGRIPLWLWGHADLIFSSQKRMLKYFRDLMEGLE